MKKIGLDATDIRILTAVQRNGQISKTRLAEIVNLSPTPCWERLNRLKAAGFITGYRADIALHKLCDFTTVIVTVSLTHHRKSDFDRFEAHIGMLDEIVDCIATGGGMDYVMKVVCPNLTAFQALLDRVFSVEVGVDRYMTYFVVRQVKSREPNLAKLIAREGA